MGSPPKTTHPYCFICGRYGKFYDRWVKKEKIGFKDKLKWQPYCWSQQKGREERRGVEMNLAHKGEIVRWSVICVVKNYLEDLQE